MLAVAARSVLQLRRRRGFLLELSLCHPASRRRCGISNGDGPVDVQLADRQGRVFSDSRTTDLNRSLAAPLPAGPWTVRTALGQWSLDPLTVRRTGNVAALPTLDQGYVVEWDTALLRAGDEAQFSLRWWGEEEVHYFTCAADARTGAVRVPPGLLREFSAGRSGEAVWGTLRLKRPQEIRAQRSNEKARYVIIVFAAMQPTARRSSSRQYCCCCPP